MARPVVTDSNNVEQLRKVEDFNQTLDEGLKRIMNDEGARNWLYDRITMHAHPDMTSHVPGCSDSTAFNEGARSVGSALLDEIKTQFPNQYLAMLKANLFDQ